MNLSLMLNSVEFYQILKLSMIPIVCMMKWILQSKYYSREVEMAVLVVVIGVVVCTIIDVKVNAKSFYMCLCGCLLHIDAANFNMLLAKEIFDWIF